MMMLLTGCGSDATELDRGLKLRDKLLDAQGCSFSADISADYGDSVQEFSMDCQGDSRGDISFTVTAPQTIAGITGTVADSGGKLTFDDTALSFPLLADGQVTPVSSPWIFLKTLRSGYMLFAGMEGELLRLSIDDSYADDALRLDIWVDTQDQPVRAEVVCDGRKILSMEIKSFVLL